MVGPDTAELAAWKARWFVVAIRLSPIANCQLRAAPSGRTSYRDLVESRVGAALVSLGRALGTAGIPWQLGGSGLLHAMGLVDTVRDLDVVFPPEAMDPMTVVLREHTGVEPTFTARQEDGFVSGFRGRHEWDGVELDVTAGITLDYGGLVVRLPFSAGREWMFGGEVIPLAPLEQWLLIYRFHNPVRSRLLAPLVVDEAWESLVTGLGLPRGFTGFRDSGRGQT